MRAILLVASAIAFVSMAGAAAQGFIAAALALAWTGGLLFIAAFRPTGGPATGRFRFSISDILLLTFAVAVSMGLLANRVELSKWIAPP